MAPQHNLWLAKVRSPSCKPRNHFGQELRKLRTQFGRRFNNVDLWFKKCKHCFNQLKTKAEPLVSVCVLDALPPTPMTKVHQQFSLTIILGPTLLGVSLDLGRNAIIKSCQQIATSLWKQALQIKHSDLFQSACQITRLITEENR